MILIIIKALIITVVWLIQAAIAVEIHIKNGSRIPKNPLDGTLLMFLPYVIYCILYDKKRLD